MTYTGWVCVSYFTHQKSVVKLLINALNFKNKQKQDNTNELKFKQPFSTLDCIIFYPALGLYIQSHTTTTTNSSSILSYLVLSCLILNILQKVA